jgi:putative phage-type endonuclease
MIQGTDEWIAARLGKVGASRVADVIAKTKSGWGASRANYMAELIAERLSGVPAERYVNAAMTWGTNTEPEARAAYAFYVDTDVTEVGFIEHPHIAMSGASPDGLVGDDGLVEIKAPNTATHIDTLLGASIDARYITQMQYQMACTGRAWCDFVSYDPRLPGPMKLHVQRVPRNPAMIADLERAVIDFLAELDHKVEALKRQFAERAAA